MRILFKYVDPDNVLHVATLYELLGERTAEQAISHKEMPSRVDHLKFVHSQPYHVWYLIEENTHNKFVGSCYLTERNEIGIFIFNEYQGLGFGPEAVNFLMEIHVGPFLANINPTNKASIGMFKELGFKQLQVTYVHP